MRIVLAALLLSTPALAAGPFWGYWSDGKAELSGYDLVQPRYGENRHGRAVLVFVTEPFSRARGVKVDRYDRNNADHFTAFKLNHVRKFQTGIYDYSVMTSVFVDPAQAFAPAKISFSGQEWCGHVYEDVRFDGGTATLRLDSYFEGETGTKSVAVGGAEDALLITLRGLAAEALDTADRDMTVLTSALDRRLRHRPVRAHGLKIRWAKADSQATVPAGTFAVRRATWNRGVGGSCSADVEVAYPHRIIGWSCDDGEVAKMTGSARLPYWQTNSEGQEKLLEQLGLAPLRVAP